MPNDRVLNLAIRAAEMNDAAALAQLMCELGYETTSAEMRQRLKSILADMRYRTFLAGICGKVCGMIGTLAHANHEHDDLSGKIIALVVLKTQRRGAIGRALIATGEEDFAKRGVTRVSLTTRFTREQAHQFYEALGYSKTGFRFAKDLLASRAVRRFRNPPRLQESA